MACQVVASTFGFDGKIDTLLHAVRKIFIIQGFRFSLSIRKMPFEFAAAVKLATLPSAIHLPALTNLDAPRNDARTGMAFCHSTQGTSGNTPTFSLGVRSSGIGSSVVHSEAMLTLDSMQKGSKAVTLEWPSGPLNDLVADTVAATLLQLRSGTVRQV